MSSDLKDARWQLAEEIAEEDGKNIHTMSHPVRLAYLDVAQSRLDSAWGAENVKRLAAKFRSGE